MKSDVYSFGVVLLELISGREPISPKQIDFSLVTWVRLFCIPVHPPIGKHIIISSWDQEEEQDFRNSQKENAWVLELLLGWVLKNSHSNSTWKPYFVNHNVLLLTPAATEMGFLSCDVKIRQGGYYKEATSNQLLTQPWVSSTVRNQCGSLLNLQSHVWSHQVSTGRLCVMSSKESWKPLNSRLGWAWMQVIHAVKQQVLPPAPPHLGILTMTTWEVRVVIQSFLLI